MVAPGRGASTRAAIVMSTEGGDSHIPSFARAKPVVLWVAYLVYVLRVGGIVDYVMKENRKSNGELGPTCTGLSNDSPTDVYHRQPKEQISPSPFGRVVRSPLITGPACMYSALF